MELKTEYIRARVTEKEKEKIENKAKKAKMNVSHYISMASLEKDIIVFEEIKEFTKQLSKVGNNLNQITMLAHQGKIKEIDLSSLEKKINEIWKMTNQLTERTKRNIL